MTPEAQRIAIAGACGWKHTTDGSDFWRHSSGRMAHGNKGKGTYLPDYLNDLNAMHSAVASLPSWHQSEWAMHLRKIVTEANDQSLIHPDTGYITDGAYYNATAAQRAEAFLRTLNLWQE